MSTKTERLTRTVRWLQAYAILMTIALAVLFVRSGTGTDGVLRVRGLIVEDDSGRERILIGAPIPEAANRVRTDTARVRELWGPRFPDLERYMGWYEDYQHSTNGIVILSEDGFDRIAIGDPKPDPNIGRRLGPSTGVVINDPEGFERTGYGLLELDGHYRVSFGLDSDRGTEGLVLTLDDQDRRVGVYVRDEDGRIFLGNAAAGHGVSNLPDPFQGLTLTRDGETVHELNVARDE
ncbi:MAG: hypothetical protein OXH51_01290 [Gemmatimonadetes bacterium]|nr:hypothetical protein [Gemmatimonadota bacterium]MCY3675996.1 hypothetical protein [Gemmatimonadota bacterium]MYA44006.1 hypothetical protein [Gemmatimonadota bacterium]MYE92552.1 hypothetical protein [Gemmatimonadota bacterium]MYJ09481.1 hypothetical protein [Gemmatimonadota bacterium]